MPIKTTRGIYTSPSSNSLYKIVQPHEININSIVIVNSEAIPKIYENKLKAAIPDPLFE